MTKLEILKRLYEGVLDRQNDISYIANDGGIYPKDGYQFEFDLCGETLEALAEIIEKEEQE